MLDRISIMASRIFKSFFKKPNSEISPRVLVDDLRNTYQVIISITSELKNCPGEVLQLFEDRRKMRCDIHENLRLRIKSPDSDKQKLRFDINAHDEACNELLDDVEKAVLKSPLSRINSGRTSANPNATDGIPRTFYSLPQPLESPANTITGTPAFSPDNLTPNVLPTQESPSSDGSSKAFAPRSSHTVPQTQESTGGPSSLDASLTSYQSPVGSTNEGYKQKGSSSKPERQDSGKSRHISIDISGGGGGVTQNEGQTFNFGGYRNCGSTKIIYSPEHGKRHLDNARSKINPSNSC